MRRNRNRNLILVFIWRSLHPFFVFTRAFCSKIPSSNIKPEMRGLRGALFLLGALVIAIRLSIWVPEKCMAAYEKGGVSAILRAPKCSRWILSTPYVENETTNCQFTTLQGTRDLNHDRVSCNLDLQMPFPGIGKYDTETVRVGVVALFDGHIGKEASEMASKVLLNYLLLHSAFLSYKDKLTSSEDHVMVLGELNKGARQEQHVLDLLSYNASAPVISNESRHMRILKEALLRSISDIDSTFSKEALERRDLQEVGTSATIAVLVDGQFLVANVGRSKAILCSENALSHHLGIDNNVPYLSAKELTKEHTTRRADERERLVAAGGTVFQWRNTYWANGFFTLTRAIGLAFLKSHGVISVPELTDWQPITAGDTHLVVGSSSIFRKLTPQKICDLFHSAPDCSQWARSSDCIASMACEEYCKNDLSVIVVPLGSTNSASDTR